MGAGTGAIVGKALGRQAGMKGGVGTASLDLGDGVTVGALVAVNAVGGVVEPGAGELLAGPRDESGVMRDSVELYADPDYGRRLPLGRSMPEPMANTTIGVIATSVGLTKGQASHLISMLF